MASKIRRPGYSLLEVMIAIVILTIAILAIVSLFVSGLRLKTRLTQITVATELARETVERTKSMGFATLPPIGSVFDGSIPTGPTALGFPPSPYPIRNIDGRDYAVKVTVGEIPGRVRLRSILVEVTWGDNSNVKLATRMFES